MPVGSLYTRAELRDRLRSELQLPASAGAATDERANESLQYALSQVWDLLVATDQGIGVRELDLVVQAPGDPSGIVPGPSLPLPDDFRRVIDLVEPDASWVVGPEWAPPARVFRLRRRGVPPGGASRRLYYLSGPVQDTAVPPMTTSTRLELWPDVAQGDRLALLYATQPPSLGDPGAPADDGISVDLLHDPVVRYVVARAGLRLLARDDESARARLASELALAQAEFEPARSRRDAGVRRLGDEVWR